MQEDRTALQPNIRFGGEKTLPVGVGHGASGNALVENREYRLSFAGIEVQLDAAGVRRGLRLRHNQKRQEEK